MRVVFFNILATIYDKYSIERKTLRWESILFFKSSQDMVWGNPDYNEYAELIRISGEILISSWEIDWYDLMQSHSLPETKLNSTTCNKIKKSWWQNQNVFLLQY